MKWFCRNWYWVGGVVAAVTLIVLAVMWRQLDMLVRLQMLSFVAILIHQLEEYGWPGGEPAIMNIV
ncbi:MAG: HXXEE domain-containing protein, partial [Paludibacteraceae bacterium]|nr:HXXEE domain-containing protein [Paludibacteraceae bacterium]